MITIRRICYWMACAIVSGRLTNVIVDVLGCAAWWSSQSVVMICVVSRCYWPSALPHLHFLHESMAHRHGLWVREWDKGRKSWWLVAAGGRSRGCPGADRYGSEILGWNCVFGLFIGTTYYVRVASLSLPASAALLIYPYTSHTAYTCWDRVIYVVACSQDNFNTQMLPVYVEFEVLLTSVRWLGNLSIRISWVSSILLRWSSHISFPLFLASK